MSRQHIVAYFRLESKSRQQGSKEKSTTPPPTGCAHCACDVNSNIRFRRQLSKQPCSFLLIKDPDYKWKQAIPGK